VLIHLDLNYDNVINQKYIGMERVLRRCSYDGHKADLEIFEEYDPKIKRLNGSWTLSNGDVRTEKYSLRIYDNEKEFIPLFQNAGFKSVRLLDPKTGGFVSEESVETLLIAEK
jgi:hypothetical protein